MQGENKGLSARLNECIHMAKGKFFARMDQDDISYPRRLQYQVEFLLSHPDVDLVGGSVVVFRDDGVAFGIRRSPLTHEKICAHPWRGIPMTHPTWMSRTAWLFQHQYRIDRPRTQDQDLLLRTHQKSRFAAVPQIILGYREDSLSLKKILLMRWDACGMMMCIAREESRLAIAALGIPGLFGKALLDTIAIWTGLRYRLLRHRAAAIPEEEENEWRLVWEQVRFLTDKIGGDGKPRDDAPQDALR
jgi:glycosyltransferase involved in cell wall biosynthesis